MRPYLLGLLDVDGRWIVLRKGMIAARGVRARRVAWLREPTDEERAVVLCTMELPMETRLFPSGPRLTGKCQRCGSSGEVVVMAVAPNRPREAWCVPCAREGLARLAEEVGRG